MKLDRIILFLFLLTNCKASTIVTLDCNPIESELWVPYGSVSFPIIRPIKNRENNLKSLNLKSDEKIKIYRNADC